MTLNEIKNEKKYWQRLLRLAGYYTGSIDGIKGPKQTKAEQEWSDAVAASKKKHGVLDSRSEGCIETILPVAQDAIREWMQCKVLPWAKEHGLSVKVIQGTRSYAEQDALYAQGRTKKGAKVTNARGGYSLHNFGVAIDLGIFQGSSYLSADTQYKKLHDACGSPKGFEWGGAWKSIVDTPHYQYDKFGSTSSEIRSRFNA